MTVFAAGVSMSCATDIERPELVGFRGLEPKELTSDKTEMIMTGENEMNPAVTFAWGGWELSVDNPDYSIAEGSVLTYIEMSPNADFYPMEATPVEGYEKTFTEKELNTILLALGYQTPETGTAAEGAPLYVRVRYAVADNVDYQYSRTLELVASPYPLRMNRIDVVNRDDRTTVIASLYSPEENGFYGGWMTASEWLNFYLVERDGTLWGSVPGYPYRITTDDATFYNLWFPEEPLYSYYVTVDTENQVWTSEYVSKFSLTNMSEGGSSQLTFDEASQTWTARVRTTQASTFMAIASTVKYWDNYGYDEEGNQYCVTSANMHQFTDILTIPQAGVWTVTIELSGAEPRASYASDDESYIELIGAGDSGMKSRLFSSSRNGIYYGFYYSDGSENFFFASMDGATVYGALGEGSLSAGSTNALPALDEGLYFIEADLNDLTWSAEKTTLSVTGSFNSSSLDANVMQYDTQNGVFYSDAVLDGSSISIIVGGNWNRYLGMIAVGSNRLGYCEGDKNITSRASGSNRVEVNLTDMGNITYSIKSK